MLLIIISHISCTQSHYLFPTPIDTLYLPAKPLKIKTFYSFSDHTQVNTYFSYDSANRVFFNYCIDSILPTSTFPIKNSLQDYFVETKNHLVIRFTLDTFLLRIDTAGNVIDKLNLCIGTSEEEPYLLNSFDFSWNIPSLEDNSVTYFTRTFLPSLSDYAYNTPSRIKKFTAPIITELRSHSGKIMVMRKFGRYPKALSSETPVRSFSFYTAMNAQKNICIIYPSIDSIFILFQNGTTEQRPVKSKYQSHKNDFSDPDKHFDYDYLRSIACESTSYMHLRYDSYRKYYYIVVAKYIPYENRNGTTNSPIHKPWSLMVLNEQFEQLAEIDMPDHLSKHEIMIVPEGIAIQDNNLSDDNRACFVIFRCNHSQKNTPYQTRKKSRLNHKNSER